MIADQPSGFAIAALAVAALTFGSAPVGAQLPTVAKAGVPVSGGIFQPVNQARTGLSPTGSFVVFDTGDEYRIDMIARGVAPGRHLAHIHGFATADPNLARCPTAAADANGDGYIDLIETRDAAGVTMIPMTSDPVSLDLLAQGYPSAGPDGVLTYSMRIDASDLARAVNEKFGTAPRFDRRVVFIHGVPEQRELPDSVRSLEGVPAAVTLPIACAEIR